MAENPAQLIRIARLRRFVGVFARGGDRDSTAEALTELAHASRSSGYTTDALRRARQAAELLADHETGEAGLRALLHLSSLCLETGAADAAASAAELARERATELPDESRAELFAGATLLAGIAHGVEGNEELARSRLSEARDLLVAASQPAGAALALVQQGLLDIETEQPTRAELCFAYARDFYRVAQLPLAAVEVAGVAGRAYAENGAMAQAQHWYLTAIAEADLASAHALAAELAVDFAEELEAADQLPEALRLASDAAHRCADLGDEGEDLRIRVRMQLARLAEDPREALRHVESAFEMALVRQDAIALGAALEILVSGIVRERFAPGTWPLVRKFRDHLDAAGFAALAATADIALADLKGQ